jgi:choline dehydrogenase
VGRNLADHPATYIDAGYAGPFRPTPLVHTAATYRSSAGAASADDPRPDLMFWITDPDSPENATQWGVEVVLLTPRCRGRVSLRSADPAAPPRIELPDPHDPADLDRLVEGYRRALDVLEQSPLRRFGVGRPRGLESREAIVAAIEAEWYSIPHVVGTCAMGPSPEGGAVVDHRCRVHGLEGLIVADASVIPTAPSGFSQLPTIMVAEKLAAEIAGTPAGPST